jgi:hypothetical protein
MKLGVCVPYRNRKSHLRKFIPAIGKYLDAAGIDYHIYFGHQVDDKLFNRGAMKNIAAEWAFKEGCDYIVWHDIDMIPESGCDYSFPEKHPIHIATNISQMDYMLKYQEYFGGAVLFSKEQVEKTNGYSNDYWDWGMEDDDLFWRCVLEGYADESYMKYTKKPKEYLSFNGTNSYVHIPRTRQTRSLTAKPHTISILVRANQQDDKVPIWLVGDTERRFCEYPIFRRPGYDYGLSYNNSRAYTAQLWNHKKEHLYQWVKRYENQWTWITLAVDESNIHLYMNGTESDARFGSGTQSPLKYEGKLKRYGSTDYYLGTTTSVADDNPAKWFKGDVAELIAWNKCLDSDEVKHPNENDVAMHYVVENGEFIDKTDNDNDGNVHNCESNREKIIIPNSILPFRKAGRLKCLPHPDQGLQTVNGVAKWGNNETTGRNERRYVLEMQMGTWDYKSDGIKQLKYELVDVVEITPKAKYINVKL